MLGANKIKIPSTPVSYTHLDVYKRQTLTYHEASPGHHNQIALAQENKSLPFIRANMMGFTAYSEGWALYAEQIADEIGMYENNPAGRLGYLQSTAFRASRLVVDTGMHAFGWSKQQAIDYMYQTTGCLLYTSRCV